MNYLARLIAALLVVVVHLPVAAFAGPTNLGGLPGLDDLMGGDGESDLDEDDDVAGVRAKENRVKEGVIAPDYASAKRSSRGEPNEAKFAPSKETCTDPLSCSAGGKEDVKLIDPSTASGQKSINVVPLKVDGESVANSGSYLEGQNRALTSQSGVFAVTLHAAEPMIGTAIYSSMADAKLHHGLLYNAAGSVAEQARQNPQFERIINESYWGCIGQVTAKSGNWTDGMEYCLENFDLSGHPDSPVRTGAEGETAQKNVLYASDLLFNRSIKYYQEIEDGKNEAASNMTVEEARKAKEYLQLLKANFVKRIGDVRFRFEKAKIEEGGTSEEAEGEGAFAATYETLPPADERYFLMRRQAHVTQQVYVALSSVMKRYCNHINRFDAQNELGDEFNPFGPENTDFWGKSCAPGTAGCDGSKDVIKSDDVAALSTIVWGFNSHVGDLLYKLVERDSSLKVLPTGGDTTNSSYKTNCEEIGPDNDAEAKQFFDALFNKDSEMPRTFSNRVNTWLWLSVKIARGQILGEFYEMERLISSISATGALEAEARQQAMRLIYLAASVSPGHNIEELIRVNAEHIDEVVEGLNKKAAQSSGGRASVLGELMDQKAAGQIDSSSSPYGD